MAGAVPLYYDILVGNGMVCLFLFVCGEGLSLCQLGLCAEDGFVCVLNEKKSCACARA